MAEDKQNDWALDIKGKRIHISRAESGRKGYYCPACSQEMIASLSTIIRSHFKHYFRDVEHKGECTFSNETYRHKIGKEILQRIKQIKVPALNKYPAKGEEGRPMRIRKGETIRAHRVEIEMPFYEDQLGLVKWGRTDQVDEKNLLIQPDVAFFDKSDNPILLIELVATHKPDDEKLAKLKRLGINTVLVRLPKGTEEEIEETFTVSNRTRWAYHYEQENTEYVSIPTGDKNDLSEADIEQRQLFEETFECRAAEVRNLLRAVRKCLGGEPYRAAEGGLRQEISRVAGIADGVSNQLQGIRGAIRERLDESVGDRRGAIEDRRRALSDRVENLGGRYRAKKAELRGEVTEIEEQTALVEKEVSATIEGLGGGQGSYREQGEELDKSLERAFRDIEIAKKRRKSILEGQEALPEEFRLADRRARADSEQNYQRRKEQIERRRADIRDEQEALPGRFEEDKRTAQTAELEYLNRATECIQGRVNDADIEMPGRYARLLEAGRILSDYESRYRAAQRFAGARRSFRSRAYKKWYRSG